MLQRPRLAPVFAVASIALAGCASAPVVHFDRSKQGPTSVGIVSVAEPERAVVQVLGSTASAFGLIGGIVDATITNNRSDNYTQRLRALNRPFGAAAIDAMAAQLEAAGYTVARASGSVLKSGDGKDFDYGGIETTAGAILHVYYTSFGYVSPFGKASFEPNVGLRARLIETGSKRVLYERTFLAGWERKVEGAVLVPCSPWARYSTFDDLIAALPASVDGLGDCVEEVAAVVGRDLRLATATAPAPKRTRTVVAAVPPPAAAGSAAAATPGSVALATPATGAPAAGGALAAAAAQADPRALSLGDRLRFQEFDTFSGARIGERIATVTRLGNAGLELDEGRVRLDGSGRSPSDKTPSEPTFTAPLPPANVPGTSWIAQFIAPAHPGLPPSKSDMKLLAIEEREFGPLTLQVARVSVVGYSARPSLPIAGAMGNERFTGELLVDLRTGLVVEGTVKSASRPLSFQRKLVEVLR